MRSFIYISLAFILYSCTGVDIDKGKLYAPPFKPEIGIFESGDSLRIFLTYVDVNNNKQGKREFIQSLETAEISMLLNDRVVSRIKMDNFLLANDNEDSYNILVFASLGRFAWSNPKTRPEEFDVQVILKTKQKMFSLSKPYRNLLMDMMTDKTGIMELIPFDAKVDTTSYMLGLIAVRRDTIEEEYLPSSEEIRAGIFSPKGKLLWESSYDINYTMQVGVVKPEKIGNAKIYSVFWNGLTNDRLKMPSRDYRLKLFIPANPNPYYIMKEFTPEMEW